MKKNFKRRVLIMALIMAMLLTCPVTVNAANSHTVQKGETWYSIANKYNVSIADLTAANGKTTEDYVKYGTTITIPTQSSVATSSNTTSKTHKVSSKETWYSIAKQYGVTISELTAANGRTQNDFVKVGEILLIPCKNSSNKSTSTTAVLQIHKVSSKETWYSIAKRYRVTISELAAANGRTQNDFVKVGEILLIPCKNSSTTSTNNSVVVLQTHKVTFKETWTSIAKLYGVTISELAAANGRTSNDFIYVGEFLKIPSKISSCSSTVKKFTVTLQTTSTDSNSWYNVQLAASRLNGMKLAPKASFSWFSYMGPCNSADGYKTATIYSNGTTSKAPGGGICMVSTTLMQAARGAGCTITEKHNHSLAVSYATRGNEASVSWGTWDLRFSNPSNTTLMFTCRTNSSSKTCTITCTPIN